MLLMGQDHGARHRDAELRCQRIIEELVVCPPPKRVVNHQAPVEHRVLKKGPVKGNVMRNSINDDTVAARFHDFHTAERDEFRGHILDLEGVDLGDQSSWKGVLHSKEYSDSIHGSPMKIVAFSAGGESLAEGSGRDGWWSGPTLAVLGRPPWSCEKIQTGRHREGEAPAEPHGPRTCWGKTRQEARPPNFFTPSLRWRGMFIPS